MNTTESRSPDAKPSETANSPDPARYTEQQEREMGVVDDSGHKIQPQGAFLMMGWMYVLVAGVAAVIALIVWRMMDGPPAGQ